MLIEFDLNHNDAQALLHHCTEHQPGSEDFRENARLREALETLAEAINDAMIPREESPESSETIDPRLPVDSPKPNKVQSPYVQASRADSLSACSASCLAISLLACASIASASLTLASYSSLDFGRRPNSSWNT